MKLVAAETPPPNGQTTQRVKVGMIGLAAIVLLIGVASAIFSTINGERPITAVGAPKADVVANMVAANTTVAQQPANEPLAELGVAPTVDANTTAPLR